MDDPYLSVFLLLMDNQYDGAVDYLIVNVNKKKKNKHMYTCRCWNVYNIS